MTDQAARRYPFVHVDVFTRERFGGNQLAVFTDARGLADDEMQAIATEMNFAESTFVFPPADAANDAAVRIFTPARELPFAGHPTVGTGFVVGSLLGKSTVTLELGVGPIGVAVEAGPGGPAGATMEQPLPTFRPATGTREELASLVSLPAWDIHPDLPAEFGTAGVEFLYLPLRSREAVARARGDREALVRFFGQAAHPAVYLFATETVSASAVAHARMLSLLFSADVREDPATGSAAGPFGAYLVRHGVRPAGQFAVEQGYEMGRPSIIEVTVDAPGGEVARVRVGGGVVRVTEGTLFL